MSTLAPCAACGAEARLEFFPTGEGRQTALWICSKHKMFGGDCLSDTAYFTPAAWDAQSSPAQCESLREEIAYLIDNELSGFGSYNVALGLADTILAKAIAMAPVRAETRMRLRGLSPAKRGPSGIAQDHQEQ